MHRSHMLDLLWNKYWVNTLSASPLLSNREFAAGQIADVAEKLEQAEAGLGHGAQMRRWERERARSTSGEGLWRRAFLCAGSCARARVRARVCQGVERVGKRGKGRSFAQHAKPSPCKCITTCGLAGRSGAGAWVAAADPGGWGAPVLLPLASAPRVQVRGRVNVWGRQEEGLKL